MEIALLTVFDAQIVKLSISTFINKQVHGNNLASINANATSAAQLAALDPQSQSKYQQLLSVIEEMSKDIRPTYAGSKSSAERLKRGIVYARILVRECLVETERSARS